MKNPFEFDAARNIDPKQMVQWYISNYNYSRFIASTKNVFINGERGSGKSMMLMYYSLSYQVIIKENSVLDSSDKSIGIYVPCMTPLHQKEDYKLLDKDLQNYYSEQMLVLSILSRIAKEFLDAKWRLSKPENSKMLEHFSEILNVQNSFEETDAFKFLSRAIRQKVRDVQWNVKDGNYNGTVYYSDTFYDAIFPILEELQSTELCSGYHFSFLIDDIQDLNPIQKRLLNSWVGYRDNSVFSLKMAVAGIRRYESETNHGSPILEGHDYVILDLQKPFQNRDSDFGKFLYKVVKTRLSGCEITTKPEDFFRTSPRLVSDLANAKKEAEMQARDKGLKSGAREYRDFVYKRNRAIYFSRRAKKTSNKPPYSGLDTLQHLSTGVIRNFLQPAFNMFEKEIDDLDGKLPNFIKPDNQTNVILEQSDNLWKFLEERLSKKITNCSTDDQQKLFNLFDKLGSYFRDRLISDIAEPRVIVFIISGKGDPNWDQLKKLLDIAEAAQLLYTRVGTSKKGGGRETYYVPNRMLWPRYGLDIEGQHGRASLKVGDLWAAATIRAAFPVVKPLSTQEELFDE